MKSEKEILDQVYKALSEPSEWAQEQVQNAEEGDLVTIGIPDFYYRVHQHNKTLELSDSMQLNNDLRILHEEIVRQFNSIGWKVIPETKI